MTSGWRTSLTVVGFVGALLGASCSGKSPSKIEDGSKLTKEIPKDLLDKFEIKEEATALDAVPDSVAVVPAGEPTHAVDASKSSKKIKTVAVSTAKTPAPASLPTPLVTPPSRRPEKDPIWIGEKQVFEITYFGMAAGDFTLEALPPKTVNNRKVYHVKGSAVSSKVFSLFYRLNDTVETFFDFDGFFSHRFHVVLDETKQTRDSLELNDSEKAQTFYWNRWNHREKGYTESKDFYPMPQFPQDSLSALYYLRSLPLPTGAVISFPVVSEGKNWEAAITVVRREMVNSPLGKVQAIVLKPETKYQGILQKRGDSFLWVTDDDRRWVVRLEAKVKIGTVVAALKKVELGTPPSQ